MHVCKELWEEWNIFLLFERLEGDKTSNLRSPVILTYTGNFKISILPLHVWNIWRYHVTPAFFLELWTKQCQCWNLSGDEKLHSKLKRKLKHLLLFATQHQHGQLLLVWLFFTSFAGLPQSWMFLFVLIYWWMKFLAGRRTNYVRRTSHTLVPLRGTSHTLVPLKGTSHNLVPLRGTSHILVPLRGTSHNLVTLRGTSHTLVPLRATSHNLVPLKGSNQGNHPTVITCNMALNKAPQFNKNTIQTNFNVLAVTVYI